VGGRPLNEVLDAGEIVTQAIPKGVLSAVVLGAMNFALYALLLLWWLEGEAGLGASEVLIVLALIVITLSVGLVKRSRVCLFFAIVICGFGALAAIPNAIDVPEFRGFYLIQGVIQLAIVVCLLLRESRQWFELRKQPSPAGV